MSKLAKKRAKLWNLGKIWYCKTQEDFHELFKALKKRGLEAALAGELTDHLGYDKDGRSINCKTNSRNGYSKKMVTTSQ